MNEEKTVVSQGQRSTMTIGRILLSARDAFIADGFDAVTVDRIALGAGVAKGAVYHHFRSKQDIFEAVLEAAQAELATELGKRIASYPGPRTPVTIARNVLIYLEAATRDDLRRLILVEGPVVLGWQRWREIDDKYFLDHIRTGIQAFLPNAEPEFIETSTRLIAGAIAEAAIFCGNSNSPKDAARVHALALEAMLLGLKVQHLTKLEEFHSEQSRSL